MKHKLIGVHTPLTFKLRRTENGSSSVCHNPNTVDSLFNLSAKVVAGHLPFEYVEKMLVHVPEPVQEKIIFYSFPQRDSDIYTYASYHPKADKSRDKIPYYEGLDLFQHNCVEDVIQIGFHLTGSVKQHHGSMQPDVDRRKYEVSITFDRCKIISVCCDCGNKGLSWCPHVVALALFRIRQPHLVDYRSPISDALVRMDRSQLQKFAQYLIASHPNKVLPSAQLLADQLLQPESNINQTSGAPDPTAGASVEDVAAWYLDEAGVREQLRTELANLASNGSGSSTLASGFGANASNTTRPTGGRSTPFNLSGTTNSSTGSLSASLHSNAAVRSFGGSSAGHFSGVTAYSHDPSIICPSNPAEHNASSALALNWLLRYRRLLLNHSLFNFNATTPTDNCPFSNMDSTSMSPSTYGVSAESQPDWFTRHSGASQYPLLTDPAYLSCGSSGTGSQLAAMFAKVRELLAKRDSNGPRLLSLITEELLRCPKLPVLKTRRSHRGVELSARIPMTSFSRSASAQQLSSMGSAADGASVSPTSGLFGSNQVPNWTTRLWDEVCVLWTCVVLNPDCSAETRRNWRNRFITWTRAHRCPRDEAYALPNHYFAPFRDPNEWDDENVSPVLAASVPNFHQQQQPQSQNRANRRAPVFQLPLEVSFMSWDDEWLRHLLGFDATKGSKSDSADLDDDSSRISFGSSTDLEDAPSDPFRRPPVGTPWRSSHTTRSQSSGSSFTSVRECHCPYCDLCTPLNEPFPLLCLRVAALRLNGYFTQALRLAVFVAQRLLRAFKSEVTTTANTLQHLNTRGTGQQMTHSAPFPFIFSQQPHQPPGAHSSETPVRRTLFVSSGPGTRVGNSVQHTSSPYGPPRFTTSQSVLLSPSAGPPHGKYPPSGCLSSPRPNSISPPLNSALTTRPVSRRLVISPVASPASPAACSNTAVHWPGSNSCQSGQAHVYKTHPLPFGHHSPSFPLPSHTYPISASPILYPFHPHFQAKHPGPGHCFRPSIGGHSPYLYSPPYNPTPIYPSARPMNSPKLSTGRLPNSYYPPMSSTPPYPIPPPAPPPTADLQGDYFTMLSGTSSPTCPSHMDSGWLGLPGRPIVCLVDCLLDAAAMVIESGHQSTNGSQSLGHMESASFYLCLSAKVSLFALFQQRRLSGSVNRLMACQAQEARLLTSLSIMPKNAVTMQAVCESLLYLLGPPSLPRHAVRAEQPSTHPTGGCYSGVTWPSSAWCWSALGPVAHPDSYPVHSAAQFVLDYVVEAQKQTQLALVHNCWVGTANSHHHACFVRIDDLLFIVVNRAMRFSVLETVSDNLGALSGANRPLFLTSSSHGFVDGATHLSRECTSFHPRYNDGFCATGVDRTLSLRTEHMDPSRLGDHLARTNEPAAYANLSSGIADALAPPPPPPPPQQQHPHHLSSFPYPPPSLRSIHVSGDVVGHSATSPVQLPPLPSALAAAVQACLRLLDSCHQPPGPTTTAPIPPVPPSNPILYPVCPSRSPVSPSHYATSPGELTHYNPLVYHHQQQHHQNSHLRRCLETLELYQTRLAISLVHISKSHVHRLDQVVRICDRHIHSAISLLTVSQQVFAEAVGLDASLGGLQNYDPVQLFKSNLLNSFTHNFCHLGSSTSSQNTLLTTPNVPLGCGTFSRDRINLLCVAFHLALLVVLRTLTRTIHWRRREMLAWAVSTALHVGPSACLYLITHWACYVTPREAVNWLAPAILSVMSKAESGHNSSAAHDSKTNGKMTESSPVSCIHPPIPTSEPSVCTEHALLFGLVGSDGCMLPDPASAADTNHTGCPSWYGFSQAACASRNQTNSITMAAQLLSSAVPYSFSARDHISTAVRTMAMQAAAKDPINCALPALTLAERNATAFDAVYRLVLHSAETGGLGPVQLFSLARYMDSRGWPWRAFPFALHATRLFTLSAMQDSHPVSSHVLWACSLAHRLGPGALQELLTHVTRNIQCPTLLTEILQRCRMSPSGGCTAVVSNVNSGHVGASIDVTDPGFGRRNSSFGEPPLYQLAANQASPDSGGKILSLDRPPLKGLLDAAVNAFVTATHTRLSNISPRQYAEFVDFLARARDTFNLLRPDGPTQFNNLVDCLRQTYRGKRKLVSLLAERFG